MMPLKVKSTPSITMVAAMAALVAAACGSDETAGPKDDPVEPSIPCADTIASVYEAPGELPSDKGAIMRCARDEVLTREQIQTTIEGLQYSGKPMTSGAHSFRILYRTERGNGLPGYSSAMVYLPTVPRAGKLPILVVSHGSRGQAAKCAPSIADPTAEQVNDDQQRMVLPMIGAGFAVISPDLAGYANYGAEGNPPSAYNSSADVSRSTLDAVRALRQMKPGLFTDKIAITGHSQGGHIALSALMEAQTYGVDGEIAAIGTLTANWMTQRTWGALLVLSAMFPFKSDPTPGAVSIWYHYTQAELLDGPGKGLELFAESKRAGIKDFVDNVCWGPPYPTLEGLGESPIDVFDPAFADAVARPAAFEDEACPSEEPAKSVCEKWLARYAADRPHLAGAALNVPILIGYGGKDDVIDPGRFQCGLDRLRGDKANLEYCFLPDGMHGELPAQLGDYMADWIASKTLGTPIEATCPVKEMNLLVKGKPAVCTVPPPNL